MMGDSDEGAVTLTIDVERPWGMVISYHFIFLR